MNNTLSLTLGSSTLTINSDTAEEIKYAIKYISDKQIDLSVSIDGETADNPSENPISEPVTDTYGEKLTPITRTRRKVGQYNRDGELVETYPSIRAATRQGYDYHGIRNCCIGKKAESDGYHWRYVPEKEGQYAKYADEFLQEQENAENSLTD